MHGETVKKKLSVHMHLQTPTAQNIALAKDNKPYNDSTISYHEPVYSNHFLPRCILHEVRPWKMPCSLEHPSYCNLYHLNFTGVLRRPSLNDTSKYTLANRLGTRY